ncbi:MAG: hypothetical protein EAX96_18610 [Candidatus Lokiarchaeota archaeon]|nr:hypothetical protein [Candidatus Lokiarchaeota archaeon]
MYELNLNLIVELLNKFIHSLDQLNSGIRTPELKKSLAENALDIILGTRLFENVSTIELIKRNLKDEDLD